MTITKTLLAATALVLTPAIAYAQSAADKPAGTQPMSSHINAR